MNTYEKERLKRDSRETERETQERLKRDSSETEKYEDSSNNEIAHNTEGIAN